MIPLVVIDLTTIRVEPGNITDTITVDTSEKMPTAKSRMPLTDLDQVLGKSQQLAIIRQPRQIPIQPIQRVILTIGIVVTTLGAPHLVTSQQHRHPLRQQQGCEKITPLLHAQRQHRRIIGIPLRSAIPTAVVPLAVLIVLAIGFVMALVVADQIVEGKTVVSGDEIDAGMRAATIVLIQIGRTGQTISQLADQPALTAPVITHHIAVFTIPFAPADGELTHLITVFAHIPRLGDQLNPRQHRVLLDHVHEGSILIDQTVRFSRQRSGQIEAETVHVHLLHPVTQAVHHHLQHARMRGIQRITATGEIHGVAGMFG